MPVLPLDQPEPFAATLGVMLYPGEGDPDVRKAKAFTAHYLAEPIRQLWEAGQMLSPETLTRIVLDGGERLDDLDKRWWNGTMTGELFKTFFALWNTDPNLASWNNSIKIAEKTARQSKIRAGRSKLWDGRSYFLSVAHLWAAWCIREGLFQAQPEIGYDLYDDFQSFLTEAEILRQWGQSWLPQRDKAEHPLPVKVWHVPDDWNPPVHKPGWPATGKIPKLTLRDELLVGLKPAGRPKTSH